jgi:hypothetical protein
MKRMVDALVYEVRSETKRQYSHAELLRNKRLQQKRKRQELQLNPALNAKKAL